MTDALRNALKLIDKHSVATVRTNSKDRGDWAEDMAYVGKVARDALAASAAPAVPPGWQLVPVEPTEAMTAAFAMAATGEDDWHKASAKERCEVTALFVEPYRAMLAAAPDAQKGAQP